jgi:hypothetical protein
VDFRSILIEFNDPDQGRPTEATGSPGALSWLELRWLGWQFRQSLPEISVGFNNEFACPYRVYAFHDKHCSLNGAIAALEGLLCIIFITFRDGRNDGNTPPRHFDPINLHIDHQSPVNATQSGHYQTRQKSQRHFLSGSRIHACGSGNNLGSRIEKNAVIGVPKERCVSIVGDANDKRSGHTRRLSGRKREGGGAACRDCDHCVYAR